MQRLERLRKVIPSLATFTLLVLGWGVCLAGVTLWAMFQGLLFPLVQGTPPNDVVATENIRLALYYLGFLGTCLLSGIVARDVARALGAFFPAYILGVVLTFFVLALPTFTGTFLGGAVPLQNASADLAFRAFFPIQLFLGLVASLMGASLSERFQ